MKMYARRIAGAILNGCCVLAMGCSDQGGPPNGNVMPRQELRDLEAKIAMILPADAILLASTDGGGRDPSYGFYAWTIFSRSPIKMPLMHATGVKDYLRLPLADTVTFVEVKMHQRNIREPRAAFGSEWENDDYTLRGTLVRSTEGDYMVVERFRKK